MQLTRSLALVSALAVAGIIAGCGGDDTDGIATPIATSGPDFVATANARLQNCQVHAACIQGADGEVALAPPSDVSVITRAGLYQEYTCPEPPGEDLDPLGPACAERQPGDTFEGLPVGRLQAEGYIVDRLAFRAFLEDWLALIEQPPAFTALGCPTDAQDQLNCASGYVLVYTGPVANDVGELLLLAVGPDATGQLGLTTALTGTFHVTDPGFNRELVMGGDVTWFPARAGVTVTRYTPVTPTGG
jgi:hypothetical protein